MSLVKAPDCFLRQVRPAYFASFSSLENLLIKPISAIMPAEMTGPKPLTESSDLYSLPARLLMALEMASSMVLTSLSSALMQLKEAAMEAFRGS